MADTAAEEGRMTMEQNPLMLPMAKAMLALGAGGRGEDVAEGAILAAILIIRRCAPLDQHPAALRYAAGVMEANAVECERQAAQSRVVIQ